MRVPGEDFDMVVARGNTSVVYAVGADAVVKVPRADIPDHWIDVEARLAAAVHAVGVPTPRVLDLVEVDGRPSIVFERIVGTTMSERLIAHPDEAVSLARAMADIQTEFHRADAPSELPDLSMRVAGKIATAAHLDDAERRDAAALLATLPVGTGICHGDVHPGNVLVGERGFFVIDWFDAASGPPVADIVRSSIVTRPIGAPPAAPSHLAGIPVDVARRFHTAYVLRMMDVLGADPAVALAWEVTLAVSRLAEPVPDATADLLAVWRSRCDLSLTADTPLAAALVGADERPPVTPA